MTARSEVFKALPKVFERPPTRWRTLQLNSARNDPPAQGTRRALILADLEKHMANETINILPLVDSSSVPSELIGASPEVRHLRGYGPNVHETGECCLAERRRIAQELHDTLLQGFYSLSLQLHAAVDQLPADLMAKLRFVALAKLMARVLEEGRLAVQGLRSPQEHLRSLGHAFAAVPNELGLDPGIGFRVIVDGRPNELRPIVRDDVYRIGREAIVNAYRHSRASNIEMLIEFRPAQLRIAVRDNGRGIDPRQFKSGKNECWGLQGMRERADRIGARVRVFTRIELGTEIEVCLHGKLAYAQFGHLKKNSAVISTIG
jgi:signal transduction histidine kinase